MLSLKCFAGHLFFFLNLCCLSHTVFFCARLASHAASEAVHRNKGHRYKEESRPVSHGLQGL